MSGFRVRSRRTRPGMTSECRPPPSGDAEFRSLAPVHRGLFGPIFHLNIARTAFRSSLMSPTTAAVRSTPATPSLHDRLKDPSLLREQCYIDGAWVGTPERPGDQSRQWRRACQGAEDEHGGDDAGGGSRRARVSGLGETHRQTALQHPAKVVRPDHRQPRGPRADPDLGAGQAARRGAGRGRYRRRLCRILFRGSPPRLRRNHPDAKAGRAPAGDQAADRRLRRDHAVEFSLLDDHPQRSRRRWPRAAPWC